METQINTYQTPIRILLPVNEMAEKYPVFTKLALRNLIFKAKPIAMSRGTKPGNGFNGAIVSIVSIVRKVIIAETTFVHWLDRQNGKRSVK